MTTDIDVLRTQFTLAHPQIAEKARLSFERIDAELKILESLGHRLELTFVPATAAAEIEAETTDLDPAAEHPPTVGTAQLTETSPVIVGVDTPERQDSALVPDPPMTASSSTSEPTAKVASPAPASGVPSGKPETPPTAVVDGK